MNEDAESNIGYLQALVAAVLAVVLCLAYALLSKSESEGWLRDFMLGGLPSAAVVAAAYAVLQFVLGRRGLTRDQRIVESIVRRLSGSEGTTQGTLTAGTHEAPWSELLASSDKIFVAARSLARWSTALDEELRGFFAAGGSAEIVILDLSDEAQIERAAHDHAGHSGNRDTDRVRTNVRQGLKRIVLLAGENPAGAEAALSVRRVHESSFAFSSAFFVLYRKGAPRSIVVRAHENARKGTTSAPLISRTVTGETWERFVSTEMEGLRVLSTEVPWANVEVMAGF